MAEYNLPDLSFVERDTAEIEASIITTYEAVSGRTLAPGDPVRLFLLSLAEIISVERQNVDFAAKQNLLSYATGDYIDELGKLVLGEDAGRRPAQAARVTVRFFLTSAQSSAVIIDAGTRVAAGNIFFRTTEVIQVPPGRMFADGTAVAETAGEQINGLVPGQIRTLVQPRPEIRTVSNITEASGGASQETDTNLRERIRLAPGRFSVAGPRRAYEFWARTANQAITDVSVYGVEDEPGNVYVRPLQSGGIIPDDDVIQQVHDVLTDERVRPMTDNVLVMAPEAVSYGVDFQYWIDRDQLPQAGVIQKRVEQAVADYVAWQRGKIGRDINPDEIVDRVKSAGAKRLVIRRPEFTVVDETQVAQQESVNVRYQGIEDA